MASSQNPLAKKSHSWPQEKYIFAPAYLVPLNYWCFQASAMPQIWVGLAFQWFAILQGLRRTFRIIYCSPHFSARRNPSPDNPIIWGDIQTTNPELAWQWAVGTTPAVLRPAIWKISTVFLCTHKIPRALAQCVAPVKQYLQSGHQPTIFFQLCGYGAVSNRPENGIGFGKRTQCLEEKTNHTLSFD